METSKQVSRKDDMATFNVTATFTVIKVIKNSTFEIIIHSVFGIESGMLENGYTNHCFIQSHSEKR